MITVFLPLCFNIFRYFVKFIVDRATKDREYLLQKGKIYGDEDIEKDFYLQEIVDNFTKRDEHDPYVIDDRLYSFFRIPVLGEAVHLGTYINGLKSFHIADTFAVSGNAELSIDASLGAGPLDLSSIVLVKLASIERLLTIKLSLNHCKVHANFSFDARTGRNGSLQRVCIDEMTCVNFSIAGFGWWSCLPCLFVTLLLKLLKGLVKNIIEFKLEKYVGEVLPHYQFPIEGTILVNTLISTHSNVDNIGEHGQIKDDSDSISVDVEYLDVHRKTFVSEDIPTMHNTKLGKPIWCTNLPLFEDIVEEQDISDDESDISIQFQFSKDNVLKDDVEPLTRSERPRCFVFFRSEVAQFCNETSQSFKSNLTEIVGYEDLKDKKLPQSSRSETQFEECSPVKYSKDFLGILTKDESPGLNLSGSDETTISHNREANEGGMDRLVRKFLAAYPMFVAFTRHCDEMAEIDDSNVKCVIDEGIKMPIDSNIELYATTNEDSVNLNVGLQNKSNPIGISTPMNNAGDFTEMKYLDLCELQTAYGKKTECSNLYKDNLNLDYLETCKTSRFNKDFKNIEHNFKRVSEKWCSNLENENQSECLLDEILSDYPVINSVGVVKIQNDFNQMKHVDSILKWVNENTEEKCILKLEEIEVNQKTMFQNNLTSDFDKSLCLKDTLMRTDESNSNKTESIESSVKYDTPTTIERLNTTGNAVFRCFDNPYNSYTNPPASASHLLDSKATPSDVYDYLDHKDNCFEQIAVSDEDGLTQRTQHGGIKDVDSEIFQNDGTNDNNISNFIKTVEAFKCRSKSAFNVLSSTSDLLSYETPVAISKKTTLSLSNEPLNEKSQLSSFILKTFIADLSKSLNEGNNQTKDSERGVSLVSKELKPANYNTSPESFHDYETPDDYIDLDYFADSDPSVNCSSEFDNEEVDVGKTILCKEFEFTTNCKESETKLADSAPIYIEEMKRPSSLGIVEKSGSEKSFSNSSSSTLKTETQNIVKNLLGDSNGETLFQETLINTDNENTQIDVHLDNTSNIDSDSLVRFDEEATDFNIDCSIECFPEYTTIFGLEETYPVKGSDTNCMEITESDVYPRTSQD